MKTLNVLMIEDDLGDVILTREAMKLATTCLRLHTVDDGETALAFLRRHPPFQDSPRPNIILLDLNLPKINGLEVLQEIKNDNDLKMIPVIVLTTSKLEADVIQSYRLGANCYVAKPMSLDEFMRTINLIEQFWFKLACIPQ